MVHCHSPAHFPSRVLATCPAGPSDSLCYFCDYKAFAAAPAIEVASRTPCVPTPAGTHAT